MNEKQIVIDAMMVIISDKPPIPDDNVICNFCELEPDRNYGCPGSNPSFCEGIQCNEATLRYQDDFKKRFNIKNRKKVING